MSEYATRWHVEYVMAGVRLKSRREDFRGSWRSSNSVASGEKRSLRGHRECVPIDPKRNCPPSFDQGLIARMLRGLPTRVRTLSTHHHYCDHHRRQHSFHAATEMMLIQVNQSGRLEVYFAGGGAQRHSGSIRKSCPLICGQKVVGAAMNGKMDPFRVLYDANYERVGGSLYALSVLKRRRI